MSKPSWIDESGLDLWLAERILDQGAVASARLRALLPGADRLIAAGWALSSMTLLSPDERLVGFQLHFAMGLVAAGVSLPPMPGPAPENESEGEPASEPEEDSDLPDPVA